MNRIHFIETELAPLRSQLNQHRLYKTLAHINDIKTFMEQHVFAVWDFMSLLKALQNQLTCTQLPWVPAANPATARFINEIVLGEESDLNLEGQPQSHFEMYLDAMAQVGADQQTIRTFISYLINGNSIDTAMNQISLAPATREFLNFTFEIIASNEAHKIASAFTFGREDIIPDMFFEIINNSKTEDQTYSKLTYYLQRHIELDGDEHGPLSLKMIEELCGDDSQKWDEVLEVAKAALQQRIHLWDQVVALIETSSEVIA